MFQKKEKKMKIWQKVKTKLKGGGKQSNSNFVVKRYLKKKEHLFRKAGVFLIFGLLKI